MSWAGLVLDTTNRPQFLLLESPTPRYIDYILGLDLGFVGFGSPQGNCWLNAHGPLLTVSVYLTSPCLPNSTVAPLGDQEWGGAPSLRGRALQCGGGDGGGGEELSQAHPQLDHGGKGVRGRRLPCPGRA